jgi:DNA-binding transcriptional ArsR family regulator
MVSDRLKRRARALDNPIRRRISALLVGKELATEDVTAQVDGGDWKNVSYHLRVLEEVGLVERIGGLWRRC